MTRYMLDTNTVSHLIREHPGVVRRVLAIPMAAVCISSITLESSVNPEQVRVLRKPEEWGTMFSVWR